MTGLQLAPDTCPVCGFSPKRVFRYEAVRTVRILTRRWREVLRLVAADEDGDALLRKPLGAGPSALGHALLVAAAFGRGADELHAIRTADQPDLDGISSPTPTCPDGFTTEMVIDHLGGQSDRLVAQAGRIHGYQWLRTGRRSSREVTALEALRRAVHEACHRLEEATRGLTRLRPADFAVA
jgi:hypothetical protein